MSSDPLSNIRSPAKEARTRRVEFQHPISTFQPASTSTTISGDLPQPLEAANAVNAGYIATLHIGLQAFLTTLTQKCLTTYSVYHHHKVRTKELRSQSHKIPMSVKKLKLILQPLDEVKESEGYKALQTDLDIEMEALHRKLTDKYITPLDAMNSDAHLKRFHISVCQLLRNAAKVFIAQLDIKNYDADTAVIDLLAQSPVDLLSSPLPMDLYSLLWLYKEAHEELQNLPFPSTRDDKLEDIINNINNKKQPTPANETTTHPQMSDTVRVTRDGQSPSSSITGTLDSNGIMTPGEEPVIEPSTQTDEGQLMQITPGTDTQSARSESHLTLPPLPNVELIGRRPEGPPPPQPAGIRGTSFTPASALLNRFSQSPFNSDDESRRDPYDSPTHNFTSQELSEMDLESITIAVEHNKLRKMILKLYTHTVKLPIDEFHSTITRRDELKRIRKITTPTMQTCLSTRVVATIQSERPADRPVLAGLIREETEKTTALLRQQLKSATDQLEHVRQQQERINEHYTHTSHSKQQSRQQKNFKGGNNKKKQSGSTGNGISTVAATTSTSAPKQALSVSPSQHPKPQANSGWGRNRQRPTQATGPSSVEAVDNATAARKRKGNKSWQRSKSQRNEQN